MELTITGANAITFPHLRIWDWRVASYLFLGGLTGGLMSMSAITNLRAGKAIPHERHCCWPIPIISPLLLSLGMFFLFLDLEVKQHMYWFYLTFQPTSPMSWGAWILVLIYPPMILYSLAAIPPPVAEKMAPGLLKSLSEKLRAHLLGIARVNFVGGILLSIYTGILLSTFLARPLWNSAILPVVFLVSGMSTGTALLIIMARQTEVKLFLTKVDIWLIFTEIMVLLLFFYGHYSSDAANQAAIMPFMNVSHQYFPYFVSVVFLGIILPLAIAMKFMEVTADHSKSITPTGKFLMNTSAVLVLVGGLVVRFVMVYAGQLSSFTGLLK